MSKSHHKYYSDDTEQRKSYFERQFFTNAKLMAQQQGIPLSAILNRIKDFSDFKDTLKIVWSQDASLLAYFEGMDDDELEEFFNRDRIQSLIEEKEVKEEKIPDLIIQEDKKTQNLFLGEIKEKKTGKTLKVFAKKEFVEVKGKKQQRYRDSKGRFSKKV